MHDHISLRAYGYAKTLSCDERKQALYRAVTDWGVDSVLTRLQSVNFNDNHRPAVLQDIEYLKSMLNNNLVSPTADINTQTEKRVCSVNLSLSKEILESFEIDLNIRLV